MSFEKLGVGGGLSDYSISSWPWLDKSQVLGTKARVKARAKELDKRKVQRDI